ncbi:hypothetical protein [Streptomyces sp. 549]|uniref:hypothetical protein n=1 Tax=Streptomyces sp. 549 TaxID=3049076 RepID=UPI0024C2D32C|nr:hypothetical protein [Streptomyces sp. 549]
MLLAELVSYFLPEEVKTRRAYLVSCAVTAVLAGLVVSTLARHLAQPSTATLLWWFTGAAGCVGAGYLLAYPFASRALMREEK